MTDNITNETKARILAATFASSPEDSYSLKRAIAYMAEWKDKEWEEKIRKWLSFNTNWNSEFDEEGRNPDYGKIDEMFDEIKKGLI